MKEVYQEKKYSSKSAQFLFVFICFFIYFSAQLGRYSYSSNINLFIQTAGVNKTQAGLVTTLYFLFYGAGQIVNGVFCKKYNKRAVCFFAVVISAAVNLAVFFGVPFNCIYFLWIINALAQSFLWPTLILSISLTVEKSNLAAASIIMSCASTAGTFASCGMGALFSLETNFKFSFLLSAAIMLLAGVFWIFASKKVNVEGAKQRENITQPAKEQVKTNSSALPRLGFAAIAELSIFSFISYAIGGGISTWMATMIKELFGLSNGLSAFFSAFLPFFAIFNSIIAEVFYKKCKTFNLSSALVFAISLIISAVLIFTFNLNCALLIILLILLRLFTGVETNLTTSKAPLYLADRCDAGFLSGILNGTCYLGNSLASFFMGLIADNYSWSGIFVLFAALCLFALLFYPIYLFAVKKSPEKAL